MKTKISLFSMVLMALIGSTAFAQVNWTPVSGGITHPGVVGIGPLTTSQFRNSMLHLYEATPGAWPRAAIRFDAAGIPDAEGTCTATGNIAMSPQAGHWSNLAREGDFVIRTHGIPGTGELPGDICAGDIILTARTENGNLRFATWDQALSDEVERMRIDENGNVVIGNVSPFATSGGVVGAGGATPYKLYVEEGIMTEKLKVAINTTDNWADHVFAENYHLKSLDDVEQHIKVEKHLPNMPSAAEVVENGVDVAEMDALLLRQIEELWLHMIALKKENDVLKMQLGNRELKNDGE